MCITLCPEVAGGGTRLFEDGLPASSWNLRQSKAVESGALCLLYDRVRKAIWWRLKFWLLVPANLTIVLDFYLLSFPKQPKGKATKKRRGCR